MKFTEYLVMAALLVPTASVIAGVVISLAAHPEMPATSGIYATSPAAYYADMENQP